MCNRPQLSWGVSWTTRFDRVDNYYDSERGKWVTAESRYATVATEERVEAINDALFRDRARAWTLILQLLADVPEDTVTFVGAGPLETFVKASATEFIDQIEREHKRNPRFQAALFEIWLRRGELPPETEGRLLRLLGPQFELLPDGPE